MTMSLESVSLGLDVIGIFAFAIAGGLVGVRARLDLFGIAVLAGTTGLGGGITRDVLLGDVPPRGISDPWYLGTVLLAWLGVIVVRPYFKEVDQRRPQLRLRRIGRAVTYLDAVGLAVFAVSGSYMGVLRGAPPLACIFVGGITAVGGGMIRDVLAGQVPEVLRREVYAVPALIGATLIVLADQLWSVTVPVLAAVAVLVFVIRVAAITLDLHIPTVPDQGDST